MPVLVWPRAALTPQTVSVDMSPRTTAGVPALDGFTQVIASPAGVWSIKLERFAVYTPQLVLLWRALSAQLEGRLYPILVPAFDDHAFKPLPVEFAGVSGITHDDGTLHDDDTGYRQMGSQSTGIRYADGALHSDKAGFRQARIALTVEAFKAGATKMRLNKANAGGIQPGMLFSVGERLYIVRTVTAQTSTTADITFWPPARQSVIAGAKADFDTPVCKCRLATDRSMDLQLQYGRFGFPSVSFVEDPD